MSVCRGGGRGGERKGRGNELNVIDRRGFFR